jgi:hypothetical protein
LTITEARLRRRLFRPYYLQVFRAGELVFGEDEDTVKYRRTKTGVRIWMLWSNRHHGVETNREVMEWWFPVVDELRVSR